MLEQNCLYPECDDKDFLAKHLFAMDDTAVIAYARLLPPGVSYPEASIGRVIVSDKYRSQKLGYQLMDRALVSVKRDFPMDAIRISAQAHLQRFYENLGFEHVGEPYLEDDIPHIEMLLANKKEE